MISISVYVLSDTAKSANGTRHSHSLIPETQLHHAETCMNQPLQRFMIHIDSSRLTTIKIHFNSFSNISQLI